MSSRISSMITDTIMGVLGVVIFVLIGVALGPTVIASVADINTTTLTANGTITAIPLTSVIILLATYLPSFYYIALVLGGMVGIWAAVKYTK